MFWEAGIQTLKDTLINMNKKIQLIYLRKFEWK